MSSTEPERAVDAASDARRRRVQDAQTRADMSASQSRSESAAAQVLIDEFVAAAKVKNVAPEPLRAQLISGGTAKTDQVGWYIKANKSIAIGTDGHYYVLTVSGGLKERLTGVRLAPSPPPLVVSRGGRDGESGDLAEFLQRRLQG